MGDAQACWNGVRSNVNVGGDPSLNFSAKFKCFKIKQGMELSVVCFLIMMNECRDGYKLFG